MVPFSYGTSMGTGPGIMVWYGVVCYARAGLVLRACGCAEVVVGRLRGGALVIIRRQTALTHSIDLGSLSGSSLDLIGGP